VKPDWWGSPLVWENAGRKRTVTRDKEKPEWWGSPLVWGNTGRKRTVTRGKAIIIIIIIIKTWLAPEYIYTNAKICNSRHMFNCKTLSEL